MSAASARAALIDLASSWRQRSNTYSPGAGILVGCARELDETTITHLSNDTTTDQWASTQLRQALSVFVAAMASEGIPAPQRKRVLNIALHGHPSPETSADDEEFVTALATSLVVLVARWRERAAAPVDSGGMADGERTAYTRAAAELEAVLRSAT